MSEAIEQLCELQPAAAALSVEAAHAQQDTLRAVWILARKWLTGPVVPTVVTAFGTFAAFAIQGFVLARMLGPQARGEFGTAVLYTQAFMFIAVLGPSFSITRRAAKDPAQSAILTRSAVRLGALTGMFTMVVVVLLSTTTLPSEKSFLWPMCIASALILPLEHTRLLLLAVDCGVGEFRRYNANQLLTAAVFPTVLLIAWYAGVQSVWTVVVLTFVGPLAGLLLRLCVDKTPTLLRGPRARLKTVAREGGPYVVSVASGDLFGRLDAMLFLWMGSFTAQGYYAAAVSAASLLVIAPNSLAIFTFNLGARGKAPALKQFVRSGVALCAVQIVAATILALILHPLITFVYGRAFVGAVPLAIALVPAQAINGFVAVADGYLRGRGKIAVATWARGAGAVVMILAALLLSNRFHELAIPLAAGIARLGVAIVLGIVAVRDVQELQGDPLLPAPLGEAA